MAEKVWNLTDGVALAAEAIDGGRGRDVLAKLVEVTNRQAAARS